MKPLRCRSNCLLVGVGLLTVAREPSHWGTGDRGNPVAPRTAVLPLPLPRQACRWHRGGTRGEVHGQGRRALGTYRTQE